MTETFGYRLKTIRLSRNMSQDELAELLGTSKQVISRYENDIRTPKITVAKNYADTLGVSLSYLLCDDSEKSDSAAPALTDTESQLVAKFRQLSPEHQDAVMQIVSTMALTDAEKNNAPAGLAEAN